MCFLNQKNEKIQMEKCFFCLSMGNSPPSTSREKKSTSVRPTANSREYKGKHWNHLKNKLCLTILLETYFLFQKVYLHFYHACHIPFGGDRGSCLLKEMAGPNHAWLQGVVQFSGTLILFVLPHLCWEVPGWIRSQTPELRPLCQGKGTPGQGKNSPVDYV